MIVARQDSLRRITEQNPWIIKTFKLPQNEIKISKMLFTREHCSSIDPKSSKDQEPIINLKVGPFLAAKAYPS